jgi:hypothetical protein
VSAQPLSEAAGAIERFIHEAREYETHDLAVAALAEIAAARAELRAKDAEIAALRKREAEAAEIVRSLDRLLTPHPYWSRFLTDARAYLSSRAPQTGDEDAG